MKRLNICLILASSYVLAQAPAAAPKPAAPKPAPAKSAPIPSYKDLKYPALREVKIPEPAQFTLSNGIRVFLLEDHELPLVRGVAMLRTGNLFDPDDKRGLSQIMAEVIRSGGTTAKTGDQIDEELENIAASVESGMDETSASVTFSGLAESTDAVLAQFKSVLTDPAFRQDKIDLSITQLRGGISRKNDEASGIPGRELASILYGRDTAYGAQIEYAHLAKIKRDDLVTFYKRYYFPKNVMLGVYGDFQTAAMRAKLESLFADWKVEQPAVPAFPKVNTKPVPGVHFANREDVTQAFFSIGHLGGTLLDKDYPALEVAANILGEGFRSRLVSQIRTKLGYAYSIGASWGAAYDHPGMFTISGSTKSPSTIAALQAVNGELEKLRSTEVADFELKEAKEAVVNGFVFFFDNPLKTLNRVMRYEYYGYPKDFLFQYQKGIQAVTKADVMRVAREHLRPENLTIVAVGNEKEFDKPVSTLGKVTPLDLTIQEPKQELAQASDATLTRGKQLLQRAQQAAGGADKLAGIKDVTQMVELAMEAAAGGIKMKQTNRYVAPDHFRQEQDMPFGKIIAYTDGKTGWLSTPQGVAPMPAEILKQAQGEAFRNYASLLLSDRTASRKVNATGDSAVEISDGAQSVRVEFEAATGLPSKFEYQEAGGGGAVVESFSDYRDADGLKLPFKVVIQQNGNKIAEGNVSGYRINTGLTAEELSKRP